MGAESGADGVSVGGSGSDTAGGRWSRWRRLLVVPGTLAFGVALGLALPAIKKGCGECRLSEVLGWTYFCAWSASFYPQVFLNHQRKSVIGLSMDYQLLNAIGFACYAACNVAMYFNPTVQQEYRDANGGKDNVVQLNDVVFAVHALTLTLITLAQIWVYYDYPPLPRYDKLLRCLVILSVTGVIIVAGALALLICLTSEHLITWLVYFNVLAQVKVVISVLKYCPQVWMNYQRQSTAGFNIDNVLLDFTGGFLSVAQLLLDADNQNNWGAVFANPAKLLLGNLSMVFDVVFMTQHFCLYSAGRSAGARSPLIES